jgi:hypothetical protein
VQASFSLGYQAFGKAQVMESLFHDLGSLLRWKRSGARRSCAVRRQWCLAFACFALGAALLATKGYAAPEVEHAYTQARALCQQMGETPQLVPVLFGLWRYYGARPQFQMARELGDTLLRLAQRDHNPALAVIAHNCLGVYVVLPGRVACCPPAPGGRYRLLHARAAPCVGIPHGPRSRYDLPHLCRCNSLVTGVPGASPGLCPRRPGVGARAGASL